MDSRGARVLQVRLALGGKVGARVTLLSTHEQGLLTRVGEAGEVKSLNEDGTTITVEWDRGGRSNIDLSNSQVEVQPGL
ncbi:MAG TPA: hypothetical protein VK287_08945 [Gaiellaceae bacterium]|nr:hypothetical protein [Gaiellaceae bacterium]